jgi:hypothetical protein
MVTSMEFMSNVDGVGIAVQAKAVLRTFDGTGGRTAAASSCSLAISP